MVISYIFEQLGEVTPLALQKILYFIQGLYFSKYGIPLFSDNCQAWVHGPVYAEIYDMFSSFRYDPIDDPRFELLKGKSTNLNEKEREVIDLVVNTFGMYGGVDAEVTLECKNELAGVVIDRFGHDVWLIPQGEDHFKTRVLVSVSPQFFGWVTGIGTGMRIIAPENVKQQYKEYLQDVLGNY